MISELIKSTNAYKVLKSDKKRGALSHAYLVALSDEGGMDEYLKIFAKVIMCNEAEPCSDCRVCRLIDKKSYPDVSFYPSDGAKLNTADADDIVAQSIIKPLESQKRLFVISKIEALDKNQNKLLKTLEEPPEGVVLLMGTLNETAVLPTVKSRVKKIRVGEFSSEALYGEFKNELTDGVRLKKAVAMSFGNYFSVRANYENDDLLEYSRLASDTLNNMLTSRDVAEYAARLKAVNIKQFVSVFKLAVGDLIRRKNALDLSFLVDLGEGGADVIASKYKLAALVAIVENTCALERSLHFNANSQMVIEKLLFGVLEEKYKWQKL